MSEFANTFYGRYGDWDMDIGVRIKHLREDKGLSLRKLANLSEISPSLMSQIENGKSDPSLTTLRKIAQALDLPVFQLLLEEINKHSRLVRIIDRRKVVFPKIGLEWEIIHSDGAKKMGVMNGTLEPGGSTSEEAMAHVGEECVIITEGEMDVQINGQLYKLKTSDSLYFDSSVPHRLVNNSKHSCHFLSIITPPRF